MSKDEKTILQILFPQVRAELLRAFFSTPPKQRYVRELMAITGLAMHTIQDKLRKLSAIGLLVSWSNGYDRFYRAHPNHALFDHVHSIVRLSERLPKNETFCPTSSAQIFVSEEARNGASSRDDDFTPAGLGSF